MRLLLAHSDLAAGGGAEAYAHAILRLLGARGHSVDRLDIAGLARADQAAPALPLHMAALRRYSLLSHALVCRRLHQMAPDYDAVICSFGETPSLPVPALQLRHAPVLFSTAAEDLAVLGAHPTGPRFRLRQSYAALCRVIAGAGTVSAAPVHNVANSHWTADRMAARTGIAADDVVYPQVDKLPPVPPGTPRAPAAMVALGRIVPNKRLDDAIAVLRALRAQGMAATLDIVGRADTRFARRFVGLHSEEPGLRFHLNVDTETRNRVLARCSIGLHCYRAEHFGIAVAEMIDAGVIPLVHDDGGVCELVPLPGLRSVDARQMATQAARLAKAENADRRAMIQMLQTTPALRAAQDFDLHMGACLDRFLARVSEGRLAA